MNICIIFFLVVLGCCLFYQICKYVFVAPKSKKSVDLNCTLEIDVATNKYIKDYIDRMPKQYKDNSRVLEGSGKTHFIEVATDGSNLVKQETFSVLAAIGDRFS